MTDRLLQSPCFRTASAKRRREADSSSVATACQDLLDVQDHERTELSAKVDLGEGETGLHAIRQAATKADGEKPFDLFHETNSLGLQRRLSCCFDWTAATTVRWFWCRQVRA